MKIILLAVTSVDGFITRKNDPDIYKWTSVEDQALFFKKIEKAKLIFMGSKTYEYAKRLIKHKKGRTRIVFTKTPEKYKSEEIPGILEFTSITPKKIVSRFERLGVAEALVVGGGQINALFMRVNLISELHVTIEPVVFGAGTKLFSNNCEAKMTLLSSKKLNSSGTLFLKYRIHSS